MGFIHLSTHRTYDSYHDNLEIESLFLSRSRKTTSSVSKSPDFPSFSFLGENDVENIFALPNPIGESELLSPVWTLRKTRFVDKLIPYGKQLSEGVTEGLSLSDGRLMLGKNCNSYCKCTRGENSASKLVDKSTYVRLRATDASQLLFCENGKLLRQNGRHSAKAYSLLLPHLAMHNASRCLGSRHTCTFFTGAFC